jgi:molybdopterin-containing oxidoreductase family iron-sulfur binding subunit
MTAKKTYWRSLDELADSPDFRRFLEREFQDPENISPVTRRRFLQLMGASIALASAAGCRWEEDYLVPLSARPEGFAPGVPRHFSTTWDFMGVGQPLVITSYDGRPIKVEGNDEHPMSLGATSTFAQAMILELYDPERSKLVLSKGAEKTWTDFFNVWKGLDKAFKANGGEGLAFLGLETSSQIARGVQSRLQKAFPKARFVSYEPIGRENVRAGAKLAFGAEMEPVFNLERADIIASFDCDLLHGEPASLAYQRGFARRRSPDEGEMNRLYAVESTYSPTGGMADHRLPLRSEQIGVLIAALEAKVMGEPLPKAEFLGDKKIQEFLNALAEDLLAHKGKALVAVGPQQPAWVHAKAFNIGAKIGSFGSTLRFRNAPPGDAGIPALASLAGEMKAGKISTLFILEGNPVFDAPKDLDFEGSLRKVGTSIHLGARWNETGKVATWHLPLSHPFESWGEAEGADGSLCLSQPLIEPLYGSASRIELLSFLDKGTWTKGKELVREWFDSRKGNKAGDWKKALIRGFIPGGGFASVGAPKRVELPKLSATATTKDLPQGQVELVFGADRSTFDGRFANNSWLQELPDFITKLTWDNAAFIAFKTAEGLGLKNGDMIRLSHGGRSMEMPAYLLPGQAEGSVFLPLGYGRREAGTVGGSKERGVDPVGFDTNLLRTSKAAWIAAGAKVEPTGAHFTLAMTQDHFAIDAIGMQGRAEKVKTLILEADLEEYKKDPEVVSEEEKGFLETPSLFTELEYKGEHQWGMSIDLSKCTGCNACVVACQSENNIPVVGKEQVLHGREMHWLRIDRYFSGEPEDPQIVQQPMPCLQCELAPCEEVCPVGATTHSEEGLNDMAYNRCVGTRYCANNCPVKVRRFNYFNYFKDVDYDESYEVKKLVFNPEVTVRHRGVMEKCTFCVQRIKAAKIPAKNEGRILKDGEIKTACEQVCSAEAISFGDLKDEGSRVTKHHSNPRGYEVLPELKLKARTKYLARIRNPNKKLG